MISHDFPVWDTFRAGRLYSSGSAVGLRACLKTGPGCVQSVSGAGHGPVRGEFHAAARLQGTCIDPRCISRGARSGRLRGSLLLSGAGQSRDRCGGSRVNSGDRSVDRTLRAVFGRARAARFGALRNKRDTESRRRGPSCVEREPEAPRRNYRRGVIRWPGSEVSDLGARAFPERARGGHPKGARAQGKAEFPGGGAQRARSTGMMAGGGGSAVAGGPALHIPVLGRQAVSFLKVSDGGVYIDGTFGAGGYTRAILAAADCKAIGIDRDQTAIALGADLVEQAAGRLTLVEDRFSNLEAIAHDAGYDAVDGVIFDLGVSSMQLDSAERGFSFRHDGPLDMRMSSEGANAADVVNSTSERDLAGIIFTLGEERHSRAVARAIVNARIIAPIATTHELAQVVATVVRPRAGDIHPATRTFQALRIFLNDELGELVAALLAAERILKPGARLVVVSFHSLEDRIVKTYLADRSETRAGSRHAPEVRHHASIFQVLTRHPLTPAADEIASNPRARSAKLRAAERTEAAARRSLPARLLPHLPALASVLKGR